ncbi:MAG: DinB family protein [Paenibacillaceae bacterium]|nr:DinB family protein [Paenibacillaceae bacterium]
MESTIFHHVERVRRSTLKLAEGLDEAMLDVKPAGFNNTIRWNLGHILTTQEGLLFGRANEPMNIPGHYRELFGNGTKPADWTVEPPTLAELIAQLKEQPARIRETFAGKLDNKVDKPFQELETIGNIALMTIYHEGTHVGYIMAIKRAIIGAQG